MNVFDFAMKMETDAEAFYKKLSQESNVDGIKNIFLDLAADEHKHYQLFETMKQSAKGAALKDSQALENAKNVFAGLLAAKSRPSGIKGDLEAYEYAMKLEAKGARFYEDMAQKETDPGLQALLKRVAEEEFKHFKIISNVRDFVNAPNQFLAWGEFSNQEEFMNFGRDVDLRDEPDK